LFMSDRSNANTVSFSILRLTSFIRFSFIVCVRSVLWALRDSLFSVFISLMSSSRLLAMLDSFTSRDACMPKSI